jgi:hypothetical protein
MRHWHDRTGEGGSDWVQGEEDRSKLWAMTSADSSTRKDVGIAALAAAASGILGIAAVWLWLKRGLPFTGDVSQRASYLVRHHKCWSWGWVIAAFGAVMVVNLYRALAARWQERHLGTCRLAMVLATAGLGVDLSGIVLWMLVAPGLETGDLALVEKMAAALSLFVAKILYAAAGGLLTLAGWREMGKPLTVLSLGVWLSGFWVAGATVCSCGSAQFWSLGALVTLFILWSTLLGLHFTGILSTTRPESAGFISDPRD